MPLRLRRGTNTDRLTYTPVEGEPIYTTDTKKLYIGDGSTPGGVAITAEAVVLENAIGITELDVTDGTPGQVLSTDGSGNLSFIDVAASGLSSVEEDTDPVLGGNLTLNNFNIVGTGNISISGELNIDGDVVLGTSVSDTINIRSEIVSDLVPFESDRFELGSINKRWANVYANGAVFDGHIDALSIKADLYDDTSVLSFDSSTGVFNGDFKGNVLAFDDESVILDVFGRFLRGNVIGDVLGDVTGDLQGSVFSGNSETMIDGVNGFVTGDVRNLNTITERLIVEGALASPIEMNAVTTGTNGPNVALNAVRNSIDDPQALQPGDTVADIAVSGYDGVNNEVPTAVIKMGVDRFTTVSPGVLPGRIVFLTYNSLGATGINNGMVFNSEGNLGIKTDVPAEALDVRGNITTTGFVQFGSFSDAEIATITPANGMVYYNSTANRFRGYQNGGWINLDDGTAA